MTKRKKDCERVKYALEVSIHQSNKIKVLPVGGTAYRRRSPKESPKSQKPFTSANNLAPQPPPILSVQPRHVFLITYCFNFLIFPNGIIHVKNHGKSLMILPKYQYPIHCHSQSSRKTPKPQSSHTRIITRTMCALICVFCSRLTSIRVPDYQNISYGPQCNRSRPEHMQFEAIRLKRYLLQAEMFTSCKKLSLHKIVRIE